MRFIKWLLLAILLAAAWFAVDYYRHRFVRANGDLVKLLPPGDQTVFFVDLAAVRQAGLLRLLAGIKPAPEKEYGQFMSETQFDFARDLNAIAGAYDSSHWYLAGRGRFDWGKLKAYAVSHGGSCGDDFCQQPCTTPGKWANYIRIQPDVVGLAVSNDRTAADALRPPGKRLQGEMPTAPVWVSLSRALRTNPSELPFAVQIFAISVQSAEAIMLSVQPVTGGAFEIHLQGDFQNAAAADTSCQQLDIQTKTLQKVLADQGQKDDPAGISGLLTGGRFHCVKTKLEGNWPLRKELLAALE